MRTSLAPDGGVELVLPMPNFLFIQWALWTTITSLDRHEGWFRELTGLSLAQAQSLDDETTGVRYALEGRPRRFDPKTGSFEPPLRPRRTGTAWDDLPRIEAEKLPDGQVAITLPQEKLAVLPELLEASLVYVAPRRTEEEESAFRLRFVTSTEEAEAFRDQLRRLDRETRVRPSS
jgi:hypothetical protein